jgi:Uma2 family endonuclease
MMDTLIVDPHVSARLIEQRRAHGADKFDEVWEGVYVMPPAPNDEHQDLAGGFTEVLRTIVDRCGLGTTRPGINLAIDPDDWEQNYRVPDVVVFLNDSPAVCHGIFWCGPPYFVVEITSPWDKTREKLNFYRDIGAREVLIVDRDPWQLELFRLQGESLAPVAAVALGDISQFASAVIPVRFRLVPGTVRPIIEVSATQLSRSWTV